MRNAPRSVITDTLNRSRLADLANSKAQVVYHFPSSFLGTFARTFDRALYSHTVGRLHDHAPLPACDPDPN